MVSQRIQMMTPFEKAIQHEHAGEYGKAVGLLRQCLNEDGHDKGDLAFHLGWCLENDPDGDPFSALQHYEQAFAEAPALVTRVNSAFRSGWVLMQNRDYERAEVAFRRAIELAERSHLNSELYHNALFWYTSCLERRGLYIEAAANYTHIQKLSPLLAPESLYRQIICWNQVGRYEDALAVCRAFPDLAPGGFNAARHHELLLQVRKEEDFLIRCLAEEPPGRERGVRC